MAVDYLAYGEQVQKIRESKNLKRMDVSKDTGIAFESIRVLEKGIRVPKLTTLEYLSDYYKVDLIALLSEFSDSKDLFSSKTLLVLNQLLNEPNIKNYYDEIRSILSTTKKRYFNKSRELSMLPFIDYLGGINNLVLSNESSQPGKINDIRELLQYFSGNTYEYLSGTSFHYIEIQLSLKLIELLKSNSEHQEAKELLNKLLEGLDNYDYPSSFVIESHCKALLIQCIYLQKSESYSLIVDKVDYLLKNDTFLIPNDLRYQLLVRKCIAFYYMGNDSYKHICAYVLLSMKAKHAKLLYETLRDKHRIDAKSFMENLDFDSDQENIWEDI